MLCLQAREYVMKNQEQAQEKRVKGGTIVAVNGGGNTPQGFAPQGFANGR
jgi:hypothetical protein